MRGLMWTVVVFLLAVLAVSKDGVAAPPEDIRAYCQSLHPDSYRSQLYCAQKEEEARNGLARRPTPIEPQIWTYCGQMDSWRSVDYCVRKEEEAKRALERRR